MRVVDLLLALSQLATAGPVAAQTTLALGAGVSPPGAEAVVNRALLAAALKSEYTVSLISDWPQYAVVGSDCVNGCQEVIEGPLALTSGGNYRGLLSRRAIIHFCGSHGMARDVCSLTLRSTGTVSAIGEVRPFTNGWTGPLLELHWSAAIPDTDVVVDGDCPASFNEALRRMYVGVRHALEFQLPVAGEGHLSQRLEDYGWVVEID